MGIADGNRAVRLIFIAENLSAHTQTAAMTGATAQKHIYIKVGDILPDFQGFHWEEQGMLGGTRNRDGASQPLPFGD